MDTAIVNTLLTYSQTVAAVMLLVFILARLSKDNSIMDIFYGPTFLVATGVTLWQQTTLTPAAIVLSSVVTLWVLRLGLRIAKKNLGRGEDARYAAWRTAWMQRGYWYFVVRSFIQINVLQGVIIVLVSLPIIITLSADNAPLTWFTYIGIGISLFGLLYESIADWQLDAFIARKRRGDTDKPLMDEGLFRYSRRPNYFGESLIWWGLAISTLALPWGWLALIGPTLITFIVTRVTGPMLEEQFAHQYPEEFARYQGQTNYFIPGPPKTSD